MATRQQREPLLRKLNRQDFERLRADWGDFGAIPDPEGPHDEYERRLNAMLEKADREGADRLDRFLGLPTVAESEQARIDAETAAILRQADASDRSAVAAGSAARAAWFAVAFAAASLVVSIIAVILASR